MGSALQFLPQIAQIGAEGDHRYFFPADCADWRRSGSLLNRYRSSASPSVATAKDGHRITSYNVCYTKLLRIKITAIIFDEENEIVSSYIIKKDSAFMQQCEMIFGDCSDQIFFSDRNNFV